jgi:hypothetical protein
VRALNNRGYAEHCRRVAKLLTSAAPETAAEAAAATERAAREAAEMGQWAAALTASGGINPLAVAQAARSGNNQDMFGAFERQRLYENLKLKVRDTSNM